MFFVCLILDLLIMVMYVYNLTYSISETGMNFWRDTCTRFWLIETIISFANVKKFSFKKKLIYLIDQLINDY